MARVIREWEDKRTAYAPDIQLPVLVRYHSLWQIGQQWMGSRFVTLCEGSPHTAVTLCVVSHDCSVHSHHCPSVWGQCQELSWEDYTACRNHLLETKGPWIAKQPWWGSNAEVSQCLPSGHSAAPQGQGLALAQNTQGPGINAHRHSHLVYNKSVKNTGNRAVPANSAGERRHPLVGKTKRVPSFSTLHDSLLKMTKDLNVDLRLWHQ